MYALVVFSVSEKKLLSSYTRLINLYLSSKQKSILFYILYNKCKSTNSLMNTISLEKSWPKSTSWYNLRKLKALGLINYDGKKSKPQKVTLSRVGKYITVRGKT